MITQLSRVLSRPTLLLSSLLLSSAVVATTPAASLEQAVNNNPLRSAANVARDQYRNPLPTLQFFEVTPQATVVEISRVPAGIPKFWRPCLLNKVFITLPTFLPAQKVMANVAVRPLLRSWPPIQPTAK